MKFGKLIALTIAGALTFAACKYEEGPRISFRAKRDRVANEWKVVSMKLHDSDILNSVNPVYVIPDFQNEDTIIYEFNTILNLYRTGSFGCELVLVTRDANQNPTYITNHMACTYFGVTPPPGQQGFTWLPKCSAVYYNTLTNLPAPFKFIMPHGNWTFDKGHYKIQVKPDLSFVNDESGTAKNTLDWTIVKLAEKTMKLKGLDENNQVWEMELKAINKENYFY